MVNGVKITNKNVAKESNPLNYIKKPNKSINLMNSAIVNNKIDIFGEGEDYFPAPKLNKS